MSRMAGLLVFALTLFSLTSTAGQKLSDSEQRTARRFDSIRPQPSLLLAFLREMPKGGDLHNHLFGAIYAENLINFAARDNFCVDRTTSVLIAPPCDDACDHYANKPSIACAYQDHVLYNSIVDAWSMRNWAGEEPGHDHFFATFDKFQTALFNHIGDAIAEATAKVIRPGGAFLVYQFSPKVRDFIQPHFDRIKRGFEWVNVPPATLFWAYKGEPDA